MPAVGCISVFFYPIARGSRTALELDVMQLLPFGLRQLFAPKSLRLRSDQNNIAKTLQLFNIAAINQLVIFPVRRCEKLDHVCKLYVLRDTFYVCEWCKSKQKPITYYVTRITFSKLFARCFHKLAGEYKIVKFFIIGMGNVMIGTFPPFLAVVKK